MAEMLTPQQKEAVFNRGGKLLVSAAAGSGKTKVLVDRLLSYLNDPAVPANIDEFLIITYTKAAASELRGKIAAKLTERVAEDPGNRHLQQQLQRLYLTKISTVHAFCADFLREYAYLLDIPADFRVADENECIEIQMQAIEQVLEFSYLNSGADVDFLNFINSQGFGRDDRQIPEILLQVYNSSRCHLKPDEWLEWCVTSSDTEEITDCADTVWGSYLIDDLKHFLCQQIDALTRCMKAAERSVAMEKPAGLLQSLITQLEYLCNAQSWDDIVARKNIDFGRLVFSKKCTDLLLAERIKAIRNSCKKELDRKLRSFAADSKQSLQDLADSASATRGLIRLVRNFGTEYERRKRIRRVLDFGDLEHRTLDLLVGKWRTDPTALAFEVGNRYREIMVDEYQDSNGVQDAIFDALTRKRQNCFMVGDVKQSIYQFRLADPGIFLQKYNTYAPAEKAEPGAGRKVLLSNNFRSSNGILQCVNDVFTGCMSPEVGGLTYDKNEQLVEGLPHISLSEAEATLVAIDIQQDTYREEASFVAQQIKTLLESKRMVRQDNTLRPVRPEDIVILLRSPGSVGGEFMFALEQQGIRCTMGNSVDLLLTEEINILRCLLQVINNPLQDIPLIAVLSSRIFGFTADELAQIRSANRKCSIYDALQKSKLKKASMFLKLLDALRYDARICNLSQLIQMIFSRTSMDSIFAAMPDGTEKQQNLYTFSKIATDYEMSGHRDLSQFLAYLDSLDKKGLCFAGELQNSGAVTIMSIHKSKGLEFPVVFLCGLSRSFNQESAREQVLCDKKLGLGLSCVDSINRVRYPTIAKRAISTKITKDSISEELRVLYVAMTRARDRLFMTYAAKNIANDLSDVALRLDMTGSTLMTSQVNCPGDWILQTAMQRTEAGELFYVGGRPDCVQYREPIWDIRLVEGNIDSQQTEGAVDEETALPIELIEKIRTSLEFSYSHDLATQAPSKRTATQLKGRQKDHEAAENTQEWPYIPRHFRKPSFAEQTVTGRDHGNAMHAAMQYLRFEKCTDLTAIQKEIDRLIEKRLLSADQGTLIEPQKILNLFATPLGKRLMTTQEVLREFKFSLLVDGEPYTPGLKGEQILLQGVVDCAMIEENGITVIDFKTDRVTMETVDSVMARYREQVNIYADALQRIYQRPIKAKYLYLFGIERFVEVV